MSGGVPVPTEPDLNLERHRQVGCTPHSTCHNSGQGVQLTFRNLEDQFIVHLQ